MSNLRDRETSALSKMLTLSSRDGNEEFGDQWKVLIYDRDGRDVISPLMNVAALRQKGVTLHLMIDSDREQIQDAPAVYFVRPTEENLNRIVEDCAKQLYRSIHLHFLTRIERPLLEKFVQNLVAKGNDAVSLVTKIVDQYLDLVSLESNLFSLNIKDSYIGYNKPSLGESEIRAFMNQMSFGLLSLVRVLGAIPVIRSAPGGPAEMLAHSLFSSLKENLTPRGPAYPLLASSLVSDRPRPLLLIFDRNADLFPILQHNATYQALVDDLLDHRNNRVTIDGTASSGNSNNSSSNNSNNKKKVYDLNSQTDAFFAKYAMSPFPDAVEANEKELAEVSRREAEIRSHPGIANEGASSSSTSNINNNSTGSTNNINNNNNSGKDLHEAIESLPEILARKAGLEAHTSVLQALMKQIASREVPSFVECEQSMLASSRMTLGSIDRSSVIALLKDGNKGRLADKARLWLLSIVCLNGASTANDDLETAFVQGCEALNNNSNANNNSSNNSNAIKKEDIDRIRGAASYLRTLQSLSSSGMSLSSSSSSSGVSGSSTSGSHVTSFLTSATSRASSFMAKATSFFTKFTPMFVTRVVDNLAEGRSCVEDDTYCNLDPTSHDGGSKSPSSSAHKYSEVIVFIIGGGSYAEYENLQELVREKQTSSASSSTLRSIIYGASELASGDDFVQQLERLAA